MIMDDVKQMTEYWQEQLGLMDWRLHVTLEHDADMNDRAGEVDWTLTLKQATIRLIHPDTIRKSLVFPYDLEQTLVHELLHLHAAPFDTFKQGGLKNAALEVMIDKTATALVELKRAGEEHAQA
jgi:hypothetical protein